MASKHKKVYPGVVHLKQVLTKEQQLNLLKDINSCRPYYKATQARNARSNFTKIIALDLVKQSTRVPQSFKDYSSHATLVAHQVDNTIPSSYDAMYCTSFVYPIEDGKLNGHCDKILGWVVLFSLGCSANFWIKGPQMKQREYIKFESGDTLVFNGGTEYNIMHGIDSINPNTCPNFFPEEIHDQRISIQFRQTLRNDNVPNRYNKKQYYY